MLVSVSISLAALIDIAWLLLVPWLVLRNALMARAAGGHGIWMLTIMFLLAWLLTAFGLTAIWLVVVVESHSVQDAQWTVWVGGNIAYLVMGLVIVTLHRWLLLRLPEL